MRCSLLQSRCGLMMVPGGSFATEMAFFGAELGSGCGFATKKALFDAELWRRRGFATKMAFFDAERVPGSGQGVP